MSYNKGLFATWMPRSIQIIFMLFFTVVLLTAGIVYPANVGETYSSLGLTSPDITSIYNSMYIGQAIIFPIVLRVKMAIRSNTKLFWGLLILALLSIVSIEVHSYPLLLLISFVFGAVKMLCFYELLYLHFTTMILPGGNKIRVFYLLLPALLSAASFGNFLSAYIGYGFDYRRTHLFLTILLLISALLVKLVVHKKYFSRRYPLYYIDWFSVFLIATGMLVLNHVLTFMPQDNWFFDDRQVEINLFASILLIVGGIWRQAFLKRPMWPLKLIFARRTLVGYGLIFCTGLYQSLMVLETSFLSSVMKYEGLGIARLGLWSVPGAAMAGFVGYYCIHYNNFLKHYIFSGFALFTLYYMLLYLHISTELTIGFFYFGYFIKSMALAMIYIGVWFFFTKGLVITEMIPILSGIQIIRTFLAVTVFSSLINYVMYRYQLQSLADLSLNLKNSSLGTFSLTKYSQIRQQADIVALKKILGWSVILSFPLLGLILCFTFGKVNYGKYLYLREKLTSLHRSNSTLM